MTNLSKARINQLAQQASFWWCMRVLATYGSIEPTKLDLFTENMEGVIKLMLETKGKCILKVSEKPCPELVGIAVSSLLPEDIYPKYSRMIIYNGVLFVKNGVEDSLHELHPTAQPCEV